MLMKFCKTMRTTKMIGDSVIGESTLRIDRGLHATHGIYNWLDGSVYQNILRIIIFGDDADTALLACVLTYGKFYFVYVRNHS